MRIRINELKNIDSKFEFKKLNSKEVALVKFHGKKSHVEIPKIYQGKLVTSIGKMTFERCTPLKTLTIPDSVSSIGDYAFQDCTSLNTVTLPDSVTSIGEGAFWGCTSLKTISIPDFVKSIGDWVFDKCTSLETITIPDSVTSIGDWAFDNCPKLTEVILNPYSDDLEKLVKEYFENYDYKITFKDITGKVL